MVNFEGMLCRVWETTLRVDRIRVSGSCRVQDAGTNFTAYFNHANMLFYFASFGIQDTFHYIKGPASISAFNSQSSNRASYSARVTPQIIGTSRIGQGGVVQAVENRVALNDIENDKFLFLISIFLFRHWNQERIGHIKIDVTRANKVEFAEEVNRMKQRLVSRQLLPVGLPDPIVEVQLEVVDAGARRGVVRQEVDYAIHNQYPEFVFADLVKDTTLTSSTALWDLPLLRNPDEPAIDSMNA